MTAAGTSSHILWFRIRTVSHTVIIAYLEVIRMRLQSVPKMGRTRQIYQATGGLIRHVHYVPRVAPLQPEREQPRRRGYTSTFGLIRGGYRFAVRQVPEPECGSDIGYGKSGAAERGTVSHMQYFPLLRHRRG